MTCNLLVTDTNFTPPSATGPMTSYTSTGVVTVVVGIVVAVVLLFIFILILVICMKRWQKKTVSDPDLAPFPLAW